MPTALVPKDHAEEVALFRSQIVGALCRTDLEHGALRAQLRELSQQRFRPPGSQSTRTFSVPTLERWLYAYRRGGLGALVPRPRSDRGYGQRLTPEQGELLCDIRREHPRASCALILRTLQLQGLVDKTALTPSTLRRFYRQKGLDPASLRDGHKGKQRLRWQAEHPGALWHGDVCHGPSLQLGGTSRPLRIHALLDDASRYVVAIEAHHTEREVDMLGLLVRALRRFGAPDALYLDNGATYRGQALRLGCERLGITLLHARPYDAPARGKMERFWRTLRQQCLDFLSPSASLHDVNVRLWAFVDQHYHTAPHGALMGQSPGEIFDLYADRPQDTLTEDKLKEALTLRERRRVKKDSTLSLDGTQWELDQGFLAGRLVTVVRCLVEGAGPPHVEHEDKVLVLHPVDPVHNSKRRRLAAPSPSPAPTVPFDPPTVLLDRAVGRAPKKEDRR
jgi:transposase InsO family protein